MDNNGIRFLRLKRFRNVKKKRTVTGHVFLVFPCLLVLTNGDLVYILEPDLPVLALLQVSLLYEEVHL